MNWTLTERRTVVRALPRSVAAELAERYSHVVEVTPTFDRRRYQLTARGYVGILRFGEHTIEFRPKWPWEMVRCLFSPLPSGGEGLGVDETHPLTPNLSPPGGEGRFVDLLAHRLASLMLARADAGLLRGYTEAEVTDSQFRGAIDLPKQVRHGWRQPGLFELRVDEFTPDIAWNRIPKAIANRLLSAPGLSPLTRESLSRAVAAFAQVSDTPVSARECDSPALDERTEAYRDLIAWCDLFEAGEILVSLERAFEQYVGRLVREAVGENLRVQETIHLKAVTNLTLPPPSLGGKGEGGVGSSPFSLIPDFVVTRLGSPICVWDTKWKRPDPFAADVHQVIAYAALIGVRACGLIYPGRRFRLDTFQPSTDIPLTIGFLRIPLTDDPVRLNRIIERLRNACRG